MPPGPDAAGWEREALGLLCSDRITPARRRELWEALAPELFEDPLYRALFEEIRRVGPVAAHRLRELLPARLTVRGFPDFSMEEIPCPSSAEDGSTEALYLRVKRRAGG